jgi:EpsI family protein
VRKIGLTQLVVLIVCLWATSVLVYGKPDLQAHNRPTKLVEELSSIADWKKATESQLSPIVVDELKLDDYVFQTYFQSAKIVDLYVGYYFSSMKVGAAHDPMVCFPGQGWHVTSGKKGQLLIGNEGSYRLNYSTLLAEKEDHKELVIYWYQAGGESAAGPFMQKLLLLRSKFMRNSQNNAFVRISTNLKDDNSELGRERLFAFIEDFYPIFVDYVER